MTVDQNKQALLVEVSRLYYQHQHSQLQIAKKIGISRPGVSRLLQKAREEGIVRIEIFDPGERGTSLEIALKEKYGLKKALVVPGDTDDTNIIKTRLGEAAFQLIDTLIQEGTTLGVSWGTTMQALTEKLKPREVKGMTVVQLNGGISRAEHDTHASEITKKIGENYKAMPYLLPLPAIVEHADMKQAIISDKHIAKTLLLAKQADIAVFTVGAFGYKSLLVKADYFETREVEELKAKGAVGDICSRLINAEGEICSPELDKRTIGIELHELKEKPWAIAVAGGKEKAKAISAALTGGWCNVLISDENVARELLENE